MAKERSASKASKVKKKWYQILAPKEFNESLIGETLSFDPRLLINKVVTVNLMSLTRDIKKQNIIMRFKVIGLSENKAQTEVLGYHIIPTFLKRIIRRGRDNLHDSFVCKTSDEKNVRLKPLIITVNKTKGAVINSLMKALRNELKEYVRKITYKELVHELVSHKLQSNLKSSLRKIYPLRSFEIKEMRLEIRKKVIGKKETKEKEKIKEKVELKEESDKAEEKKPDKPKAEEKKEEVKPEQEKEKPEEKKPEQKQEGKKDKEQEKSEQKKEQPPEKPSEEKKS